MMPERTDRLLFDFCLTHTRHAYEAEAPAPVQLPRAAAHQMERAAILLYGALERFAGRWPVPPFPLRDAALTAPHPPFWVRFDGFLRQGGGCFFAEVNVDRPGGHREAMISSGAFRERFLGALRAYVERGLAGGGAVRAAFLVDPAHREELHIAHFYAGLLRELGWPCTVVGPLNLQADGGHALAFGQPVNLIMRQFPTEFAHEVPAFAALLELHRTGQVLILNPPSAVAGQAKTCFAWLWEQALQDGGLLTKGEAAAVRETVPFTACISAEKLPCNPAEPDGRWEPAALCLLQQPGAWVLKPVLGRYSQGVTCGALVPADQWGAVVAAALAEPEYWIAQQYLQPAPQPMFRWSGGAREALTGYVNWGLHFLDGAPAGWMARCSRQPVTDDAWFAAVELTGGDDDGTALPE